MQIRTILAGVSGGSASGGVLDAACRLARRFNSHLEVLHVEPEPPPHRHALEPAPPCDPAAMAMTARRQFEQAIARYALPLRAEPCGTGPSPALLEPSANWRQEKGVGARGVACRARLFDLVVLGRSGRVVREPFGTTIEETLLDAGGPVFVAPSTILERVGETIAVAWDDTPVAARALRAALPFLAQAGETHVLCFGDKAMDDLLQHLSWYGVRAVGHRFRPLSEQRVETGELLLAAARECHADMLVMGAYGHAPHENLAAGATGEILRKALIPVLLAH